MLVQIIIIMGIIQLFTLWQIKKPEQYFLLRMKRTSMKYSHNNFKQLLCS